MTLAAFIGVGVGKCVAVVVTTTVGTLVEDDPPAKAFEAIGGKEALLLLLPPPQAASAGIHSNTQYGHLFILLRRPTLALSKMTLNATYSTHLFRHGLRFRSLGTISSAW